MSCLQKIPKWHLHTKNVAVNDVVCMCDDRMLLTKWPLARIIEVFPSKDNIVCEVKPKTSSGTYTRPINKVAVLVPA